MKYIQPYHATYCWCAVVIQRSLAFKSKFSMVCYCICIEFVQGMCVLNITLYTFMCQKLLSQKRILTV